MLEHAERIERRAHVVEIDGDHQIARGEVGGPAGLHVVLDEQLGRSVYVFPQVVGVVGQYLAGQGPALDLGEVGTAIGAGKK